METLIDTVNLRDLLNAGEIDDKSSPLSAPELRLLISRLDTHSNHIKSRVQSYIQSHRSHFTELLSLSSTSYAGAQALSSDVAALVELIDGGSGGYERIAEVLREIRVTVAELREKRGQVEVMRVVVGLSEGIGRVRELIGRGEVYEAAKRVRELKEELRIGDGELVEKENEEVVVYGLLRKQWGLCFEEMQDLLAKFMDCAVQFKHGTSSICVVDRSSVGEADGVELQTVLEAMDVLGILDYGLAKTADLFVKHAIAPAVNSKASVSLSEESNGNFEESREASLKIISDLKAESMNGEALFSRMTLVVEFIHQRICLQNDRWMRCFGKLTWPRMSELIISNFLSKVVPDDASRLADFQKIMNTCSEFESVLKKLSFISNSDKNDERLTNFADNVEVHFAVRKKTEILASARQSVLRCDFSIPQGIGYGGGNFRNGKDSDRVVDLLFSSEKCIVSEAASKLMKVVHQTLKDVCVSSPRVALEFYYAARDALQLYEAIIPIKLERQLDSINQTAVLMHNDCLYLSQEVLGLAFEYRPDFPSFMKEHAMFVDLGPRLQLLAEEILQRHIQTTDFNLKQVVDSADGFQNTHEMPQYESSKFSLEQVVFILEKIRLLWEPVLLPATYKRSFCLVLESVFSRITQDILLLDDIAADETLQLQRLIQFLLESLAPLLNSLNSLKVDKKSDQCFSRPLEADIPSLGKIRKLADLLDMPLKSITEAWEYGDLYGCGFILIEVVDFIKAIFTDSPLRKDCLARIYRINF
ncbi:centromere/kinetochore protein zw10 homolog [Silene latifolia]|uniref:centromere/kinetochore protein zw10 homolog n=1 Tax=Silene latifolia TaxID=37657 RepID=UPI003D77B84E